MLVYIQSFFAPMNYLKLFIFKKKGESLNYVYDATFFKKNHHKCGWQKIIFPTAKKCCTPTRPVWIYVYLLRYTTALYKSSIKVISRAELTINIVRIYLREKISCRRVAASLACKSINYACVAVSNVCCIKETFQKIE